MRSFYEIGLESGTDKVTHHRYDRFYPLFLDNLRREEFSMLEIGIDQKKSLDLWKEYFEGKTFAEVAEHFVRCRTEDNPNILIGIKREGTVILNPRKKDRSSKKSFDRFRSGDSLIFISYYKPDLSVLKTFK